MSFFDWIRFCRFLGWVHQHEYVKLSTKFDASLKNLVHRKYGVTAEPNLDNIINLSSHQLTELESFVLAHGLDHCIPPFMPDKEKIFSEFEAFYAQLARLSPTSMDAVRDLKVQLNNSAHLFSSSSVATSESKWRAEYQKVITSLRNSHDLIISRPDKGAGVIIMDRTNYVAKMSSILEDTSKFSKLGSAETCDRSTSSEVKFQKLLLKLVKTGVLPQETANEIRPSGSIRPRLYGLPKIHKDGVPVRPILSMVGSAQHKVAQWLSTLLEPCCKA